MGRFVLAASAGVALACGSSSGGTAAQGGAAASGGGVVTTGGSRAVGGSPSGGAASFSGGGPAAGGAGGTLATGGAPAIGGAGVGGAVPAGAAGTGGEAMAGAAASGGTVDASGGVGAGASGGVGGAGLGGAGGSAGTGGSGGLALAGGSGGIAGGPPAGGMDGAAGRPTVVAAPGSTLVTIDLGNRYQTFEGWGTSLAWWAYQIGGWSSARRDELLRLVVDPVDGLGYNVFRFNIGGGDDPSHDHMGTNREMPGFQSSDGVWDWSADARQTAVLQRLVATGQDVIVEAFANSPPYWMTRSGCASGSADGTDNLKDDAYDAFAAYLVTVTQHYRDELGIPFRTLEPLNEPNASWWTANGGQEGCHFDPDSQERILQSVASRLLSEGVTQTGVSASDENSMDDAVRIIGAYEPATLAAMVQVNVHSYSGSRRTELHDLAVRTGLRLWQSESGPLSVDLASNTDAALFMAGRIIQDLRELQPAAWIEWQVVDPATTWTSFTVNDAQETWQPLKRFYAQAGFSRYIRPGATFVDVDADDMVAALSAESTRLALVVRNGAEDASRSYTFDLTSFPSLGSSVEVHRTSATEDLVEVAPIPIDDWSFTATVPAYSITTFVIPLAS